MSELTGPGRYFDQYDLYRVLGFTGVVAQHAVLWPVTKTSVAGWGLTVLLHYSRNSFFFLSALVLAWAQLTRPRPIRRVWREGLITVGIPFVLWTFIYFAHTMIMAKTMTSTLALNTLGDDFANGYKQLYFVIALAQLYLLLPVLMWVMRKTRGHHGLLFAGSVVLQIALTSVFHYTSGSWGYGLHDVVSVLLGPDHITAYQLIVLAGLLVAYHVDDFHLFVDRHTKAILWLCVAVGVLTEGYYLLDEDLTHSPPNAAALFQPAVIPWLLAAIAGLATLGRWWARRQRERGQTLLGRAIRWGSDASGGYFFAHVLVLELIIEELGRSGLRAEMSWAGTGWILFFGTMIGTGILAGLLLKTPLRVYLTGPNRTEQRQRLGEDMAEPPRERGDALYELGSTPST